MSYSQLERYICDKCRKMTEVDIYNKKSNEPQGWYKLQASPAHLKHSVIYIRWVCPACFYFFWSEHFGELEKSSIFGDYE